MHAIVSTPFDFSFSNFSKKLERCFWEHVGVKAPGMTKRIDFLLDVKEEIVVVWSSLSELKSERVAFRSLSLTEIVVKIWY